MFHLVAFGQSVDPAGAYVQLNAVQDPALTTNGKFAYVPNGLANIVGAAALVDSTVAALAYFSSPSIRGYSNFAVRPVNYGLVAESPLEFMDMLQNPFPLAVNEGLEFDVNDNPSAAVQHYGLLWLGDGAQKPTNGQMFTVHATAAITESADAWVNGNLTFDDTLPSGSYQVVGLRVEGTNTVAGRLVFVGGTARPGVIAQTAADKDDGGFFRFGNAGVLGQFDSTTPPTLDALGVTDTSQQVFLDLIKVK